MKTVKWMYGAAVAAIGLTLSGTRELRCRW